ncbi:MAG TPA: carboxypeptidase-like regulatory domain-containing protein [Candidatus Dormibacteraeota bacterium]
MSRHRRLSLLALLALLPVIAAVFWLTAVATSGLPGIAVFAINVHGLTINDPRSAFRPAPLSLRVLDDAQIDAASATGNGARSGAATSTTYSTGSDAQSPSPSASSQGAPAPTPTVIPLPAPSPTIIPLPTPTPLPTILPTPTPKLKSTISGQVIDTVSHLPIAGASIAVSPSGASTTTDINGNFSLGVSPGTYTVTASAVGYNSASQTVTVSGGQSLVLSFKLVALTATGSIKGTVMDSVTAAAIAGATVGLSNGLVTITDLNGNYSFAAVLYGNYTITASATGYLSQSQPITVKPGHQTTLNFQLAR